MNKKGIALVFSFIIIMVLTILLGSVFLKTMNENSLVRRYVDSTTALWLAEAGVSEAVRNIGISSGNGYLPLNQASHSWNYTTTFWTIIGTNDFYNITATGTVPLASGGTVRRQIKAVARTTSVNADRFPWSLASSGQLCFGSTKGGKVCDTSTASKYVFPQPDPNLLGIDPIKYPTETVCPGGSCWAEDPTLSLYNLLGYQKTELEALADHVYYNQADFDAAGSISGVTYVKLPSGQTLSINGGSGHNYSSPNGSGILIVDGDVVKGNGNYLFRGVILIIGRLVATGNFFSYGSMVVQARTELEETTVNGTPNFFHSKFDIEQALEELVENSAVIVSWRESAP